MGQAPREAGHRVAGGLFFEAGRIVQRMKADELEGALVDEPLEIAAERVP